VLASPDKSLQRSVNHKVHDRARVVSALCRAPRACVLIGQPAVAELSSYTALMNLANIRTERRLHIDRGGN
jgi:hypothetical protein